MAVADRRARGGAIGPSALTVCGLAAACLALAACGSMSSLETRARIASNPPCTDFFFPIYFARGSADLSRPAAKVVENAAKHISGCSVAQVEVVGLADYVGAPPANMDLSRQRAQRVAQALTRAGLPPPVFHLSALGDAGAGSGYAAAPVRRRADIFIHFQH